MPLNRNLPSAAFRRPGSPCQKRSAKNSKQASPDVQIYHKAVDWALRYEEFVDPKHFAIAKAQLNLGRQRAKELREGKPSWNMANGARYREMSDCERIANPWLFSTEQAHSLSSTCKASALRPRGRVRSA